MTTVSLPVRAPLVVVESARASASRSMAHPVAAQVVGVAFGLAVGVLVYLDAWWVLLGLAAAAAVGVWAYTSWWFVDWAYQRAYRRRMDASGWCGHCHGRHLFARCPQRP